jgi:hypothetical protein
MLAGGHVVLGLVRFATGQFPAAREHLEPGVDLFGVGPFRNYLGYFAQIAPHMLAQTIGVLGYPLTALSETHELLAAARRSSEPSSTAAALMFYGPLHVVLRDTRLVAERADELLSIATEHEMTNFLVTAWAEGLAYE